MQTNDAEVVVKKRIVETDNFGRDYPDESFLPIPALDWVQAEVVAKIINEAAGENNLRYWKVVDMNYKLAPGFEP